MKPRSGGGLLLRRRRAPLTRRTLIAVAYELALLVLRCPVRDYGCRRRGGLGCVFGRVLGRCRGGFPGLPGTGTPPTVPTDVGGRFGGASGVCVGSKQSDMSSAVSSRELIDGMPSRFWQNFNRLMCECCTCETKPFRAYGLITRQGTREP